MAQVTQERRIQGWIDSYLSYLIAEWKDVSVLAAEWDEWDDLSQLTFVVEWPIREDRLHQLRQWDEQGLLNPAQQARYQELLKLIELHRPTLERLIAD